ncbi:hypothetical protein ABNF97_12705 [Plantactinospora sp. B6F1]|uniref:hypothetical protein n=1 Tax=Plantactinospora sp. B6F1 TaxID=3158971 RepID=UPI00102AF2CE
MEVTTEIPLVGGAGDGDIVIVDLDVHGRPPLTHHLVVDGGLARAEIYELEATPGERPPWLYRWRGPAPS